MYALLTIICDVRTRIISLDKNFYARNGLLTKISLLFYHVHNKNLKYLY